MLRKRVLWFLPFSRSLLLASHVDLRILREHGIIWTAFFSRFYISWKFIETRVKETCIFTSVDTMKSILLFVSIKLNHCVFYFYICISQKAGLVEKVKVQSVWRFPNIIFLRFEWRFAELPDFACSYSHCWFLFTTTTSSIPMNSTGFAICAVVLFLHIKWFC